MLIEGLIAILIFSIGVLALTGLQAISVKETIHSKYRTDASYFANQIIGQMMTDRVNVATYADSAATANANKTAWRAAIAAALPNGAGSVAADPADPTQVTVTVTWYNPDEDPAKPHRYQAVARVVF
ncbi:MAG: hypothetical protein JWQ23_4231 [Herminiimonas sp.]|nr:hypothetical protein [Herminiimonas sp.]